MYLITEKVTRRLPFLGVLERVLEATPGLCWSDTRRRPLDFLCFFSSSPGTAILRLQWASELLLIPNFLDTPLVKSYITNVWHK